MALSEQRNNEEEGKCQEASPAYCLDFNPAHTQACLRTQPCVSSPFMWSIPHIMPSALMMVPYAHGCSHVPFPLSFSVLQHTLS